MDWDTIWACEAAKLALLLRTKPRDDTSAADGERWRHEVSRALADFEACDVAWRNPQVVVRECNDAA